jgi:hypothetical protein
MSSKSLRYTLVAGLAIASCWRVETNLAFAQNRADGWTFGPSYGPAAPDIVAPACTWATIPAPPIFFRAAGSSNEPCGLPTSSACSNAERGAD